MVHKSCTFFSLRGIFKGLLAVTGKANRSENLMLPISNVDRRILKCASQQNKRTELMYLRDISKTTTTTAKIHEASRDMMQKS